MRYHLDIRKRRKEFVISFIIAKDYFSFLLFQVPIIRNIRDFNGEKNCKSKSSFCLNNSHEL